MIYIPYLAIAVAFALIHVPRWLVVSREMHKLAGGYDNRDPRAQQQQLSGVGRRALAAHHNSFEAFAPFAIGVLAAIQRAIRIDVIAWIAIAFVAARVVYIVAYLADRPTLRSGAWTIGTIAIGSSMLLAVLGG
jgi:uncharacterized MAPEG superfamily protein